MTPTPAVKAAILSTELEPKLVQSMIEAARAAGFDDVITLAALPPLETLGRKAGKKDTREVHLPDALKGASVIVLDEWIGGRSAFEILAMLKAAAESKEIAVLMLASAPKDSTVFAAWCAGVDCFLTKPFDLTEFQEFMHRLRTRSTMAETA